MCALGLYLAFLLFEDMIVGNFSSKTSQEQNLAINSAYNTFSKQMLQRKNISKRSIGKQNVHILNISTTAVKPRKELITGKVTQKQYEIFNMLWKSKIFDNEDKFYKTTKRTNATNLLQHKRRHSPLTFSTPSPSVQTTTSKIEFYYQEDIKHTGNKKNSTRLNYNSSLIIDGTSNVPFLIFHLKGPYVDPIPLSFAKRYNHSHFLNDQVRISAIRLKEVQKLSRRFGDVPNFFTKKVIITVPGRTARISSTRHFFSSSMRPLKSSPKKLLFFDSNSVMKRAIPAPRTLNKLNILTASSSNRYGYATESTTIYDKIKFFEIYDQFTRTPYTTKKEVAQVNCTEGNIDDDSEKILLEHVDQASHEHVQAEHEKKHITEPSLNVHIQNDVVSTSKVLLLNDSRKNQPDGTSYFMNEITKSEPNNNNTAFSNVNGSALWSDYPFAGVYIYEPSEVRCDAAAISTHWLVASGSCLSRVSKQANELYGEGQSAFVAYCGEQWWEPERVAYVKYTIVHPWYHPRDTTRQHLYNIGAIQVVNSMLSSCTGWAPVALMSHQFSGNAETTWATAVGWGLDRFDIRYGAIKLPKMPLKVYKSAVYLDSCPGNVEYSKASRLDEGGGVQNVHCLSLPPYFEENADPVHGALLLADGKLIALYLQEERRPWGDQSAQYTGVWRLIPWLMDVAREPEEIDSVVFELK